MNRLYGLLVSGFDRPPDTYYCKTYTNVQHSKVSQAITDEFLKDFRGADPRKDPDRVPLFACVVCHLAMTTRFADEIRELDPVNTYEAFGRKPDVPESGDDCMYDLTKSAEELMPVVKSLDKDIQDRLVLATYPELVAGICLQILRSAF